MALDGTKLPALTIFAYETNELVVREEVPILNERHGQYSLFCCQKKGWCDRLTMLNWIDIVWAPFAHSKFQSLLLLMSDQHPAHKHHNISEALGKLNTILLLLPPGETSRVQLLDIGVNKPFKT
jgi:hypothetical protein